MTVPWLDRSICECIALCLWNRNNITGPAEGKQHGTAGRMCHRIAAVRMRFGAHRMVRAGSATKGCFLCCLFLSRLYRAICIYMYCYIPYWYVYIDLLWTTINQQSNNSSQSLLTLRFDPFPDMLNALLLTTHPATKKCVLHSKMFFALIDFQLFQATETYKATSNLYFSVFRATTFPQIIVFCLVAMRLFNEIHRRGQVLLTAFLKQGNPVFGTFILSEDAWCYDRSGARDWQFTVGIIYLLQGQFYPRRKRVPVILPIVELYSGYYPQRACFADESHGLLMVRLMRHWSLDICHSNSD